MFTQSIDFMYANNSSGHEASRLRSWSRVELIDKSEVTIIPFGLETSSVQDQALFLLQHIENKTRQGCKISICRKALF